MISAKLILALILVESGGDALALGDYRDGDPQALGCLQIHQCVIEDVNRVYAMNYHHEDAFEPAMAEDICRMYLSIYATEARLGRRPTDEDYARIWNGGCNGYKKDSTEIYWSKVKAALDNL